MQKTIHTRLIFNRKSIKEEGAPNRHTLSYKILQLSKIERQRAHKSNVSAYRPTFSPIVVKETMVKRKS